MRILISGYYGFQNLGDECILQALLISLDKTLEKTSEKIPAGKNEYVVLKKLFASATDTATPETGTSIPSGTAIPSYRSVPRTSFFKILQEIWRTDLFISGGGGLFQDVTGRGFSVVYYGFLIFLAALLGKKVIIFGQGIGPVTGQINRRLLKWSTSKASLILVRDEDSKNLLVALGLKKEINVMPDTVFALHNFYNIKPQEQKESDNKSIQKRVPASVGFAPAGSGKGYLQEMAAALAEMVKIWHCQVVLLACFPSQDEQACLEVQRILVEERGIDLGKISLIKDLLPPPKALQIFEQLDLLLGVRLHSLILATITQTPFLAISYNPKIDAFLKTIAQQPAGKMDDFNKEALVLKTQELWQNRKEVSRHLGEQAREFSSQVEMAVQVMLAPEPSMEKVLPATTPDKIEILGLPLDCIPLKAALDRAEEFIKEGKPHQVATPNAIMVVKALKNLPFRQCLAEAHLLLPDGMGLVWAAKILKGITIERVPGIDFMTQLTARAAGKGYRIFLLGGKPGVAKTAAKNLQKNHPLIKIVGCRDGYFKPAESASVAAEIKKAAPDILFVAMGAEKQEFWIKDNLAEIAVSVCIGVGGSFDVIAGNLKRAPSIFQSLGLEWLYRFWQEPRRLYQSVVLLKFVVLVLKEKILPYWRQ